MRLILFFLIFISATGSAVSQSNQSQQHGTPGQSTTTAAGDQRGTDNNPLSIKLLNTGKNKNEADAESAHITNEEDAEAATIRLTIVAVGLGFLQLIVFGWQGWHLRATVRAMHKIAKDQGTDMKNSIAEAGRAAKAMEDVAVSMAANVENVRQNVATSREISERQKAFGELQMQAYVYVAEITVFNVANPILAVGEKIIPTGAERGRLKLGPGVRIVIRNTGNSPAYDVVHWANVCIREFPIKSVLPAAPDLTYATKMPIAPGMISVQTRSLPEPLTDTEIAGLRTGSMAIYLCGGITYKDIFGNDRFTNYRFYHNELAGRVGVSVAMNGMREGNETDRPDYKATKPPIFTKS